MVVNFGKNDIPDEIFIAIFLFLDSDTILWKLRAVCSEWRVLALRAMTQVQIVGNRGPHGTIVHFNDTLNSVQWAINSFPNLNHITLDSFQYVTINNIRKLFSYYRSIKTFSLHQIKVHSTFLPFTSSIPSLAEIVSGKRSIPSSLSCLQLSYISPCNADFIVKVALSSGAQIQRLTISDSSIDPSVRFPSTLRELRLSSNSNLSTLSFFRIFDLPNLEYFHFNGGVGLILEHQGVSSDTVFQFVRDLGKKYGTNFNIDSQNSSLSSSSSSSSSSACDTKTHPLKTLILGIPNMRFILLKYILSFLTNLEKLNLSSTKIETRNLETIRLPNLKELNTTTGIEFILPCLEKLSVCGTGVIQWLNKHQFPNLIQLNIEACITIDTREFQIPAYPLLEHLSINVRDNIHHVYPYDCPDLVTIRFPNAKITQDSIPLIGIYVQELWNHFPHLKLIVIRHVELNPNRKEFPQHQFL